MSTTLIRSTQVRMTLTVQVITDNEADLLALLCFLFTPILYLWQVKQTSNRIWDETGLLVGDIKDLFIFITKVIVITLKSFAFGLGVNR